jgi:hypothetical protein
LDIQEAYQGISFACWRDGTFFNQTFTDICRGRRVLFCSLPKTHEYIHHAYIKYIRSLADQVDQIYLVTASHRYSLVTIETFWDDFSGLYDENLSFNNTLSHQVDRDLNEFDLRNLWKYQALFDDGKLAMFTDYHVADARKWILSRMKDDYRWKESLLKQDAQDIKALKWLIHRPDFSPDISTVCQFKKTLAPMLMFDRLWPNCDLEKFLQDHPFERF